MGKRNKRQSTSGYSNCTKHKPTFPLPSTVLLELRPGAGIRFNRSLTNALIHLRAVANPVQLSSRQGSALLLPETGLQLGLHFGQFPLSPSNGLGKLLKLLMSSVAREKQIIQTARLCRYLNF